MSTVHYQQYSALSAVQCTISSTVHYQQYSALSAVQCTISCAVYYQLCITS